VNKNSITKSSDLRVCLEQKMIKCLADFGVLAGDLVPEFMTTHTGANPEARRKEMHMVADSVEDEDEGLISNQTLIISQQALAAPCSLASYPSDALFLAILQPRFPQGTYLLFSQSRVSLSIGQRNLQCLEFHGHLGLKKAKIEIGKNAARYNVAKDEG
jgi:hypothetical protein